MRNDLFYKSMGVLRALPSSSSSSRSMSSSLSESDSMSCSTFVLVCTEGGGLLSSLNSSLILVLETGDEFEIGGDSFGRSLISSRPKHRRFSGNFAYLTQKMYCTTLTTLPYSYFSNCLKSQCCSEAEAVKHLHPNHC